MAEVLARQVVELIVIDLAGYDIHIDGSLLMIDPIGLTYTFIERLAALGIRTVEITPSDDKWIVNSLALAPGELLVPPGASNRTFDALGETGIKWSVLDYGDMQINGGGIHCSTTRLIRDPV